MAKVRTGIAVALSVITAAAVGYFQRNSTTPAPADKTAVTGVTSTHNRLIETIDSFETSTASFDQDTVEFTAGQVIKNARTNGIKVDAAFLARIEAAKVRLNGISAMTELKDFETTNKTLDSFIIDFWAGEIIKQAGAGGIKVDNAFLAHVDAAKTHLNRTSAMAELKDFETTNKTLDLDIIASWANRILKQANAGGIKVDDVFLAQVDAAKVRLNGISANDELTKYETRTTALDQITNNWRATSILKQAEAGNITVDEAFRQRVEAARVRMEGISAELDLERFETRTTPLDLLTIDEKTKEILERSKAGGLVVDDKYKTRVENARERLIDISKKAGFIEDSGPTRRPAPSDRPEVRLAPI